MEIVKQPAYWHHRPRAWYVILDINRKRNSFLIQWALSDGVTASGITVVGVACFRVDFSIGCHWDQKVLVLTCFFFEHAFAQLSSKRWDTQWCTWEWPNFGLVFICHHPRSLNIVLCQDQSPGSYLAATSSNFQICWTQSRNAVPQGSSHSPC